MRAVRMGALALGAAGILSACQPPPDRSAAAAAAVRAADSAWAKAFLDKDAAASAGFLEAEGVIMAPNGPAVTGQPGARAMFESYFALPGLTGAWKASDVAASRSGELGYSSGTYEMSVNDSAGKPVPDRGKYATVWRLQPDSTWKVVVDVFNSDLPLPTPESAPKKK
jgi:ketosteroid isomerase-like protein